ELCDELGGHCRAGCSGRSGEPCTSCEYRRPQQNRHPRGGHRLADPRACGVATLLHSIRKLSGEFGRMASGGLGWKGSDPTVSRAAILPLNWRAFLSRFSMSVVLEVSILSGGSSASSCTHSASIRIWMNANGCSRRSRFPACVTCRRSWALPRTTQSHFV